MQDYMLITHPSAGRGDRGFEFETMVRGALHAVREVFPTVEWRAEFSLGPRDHVEVFSAPNEATARQLGALVSSAEGISAEISPLRSAW